jgi:hypothetical protein
VITAWADIIRGEVLSATAAGKEPVTATPAGYAGQQVIDFRTRTTYCGQKTGTFTGIAQPATLYLLGNPGQVNALTMATTGVVGGHRMSQLAVDYATPGDASFYAGGAAPIFSASGTVSTSPAAWCAVFNGATSTLYYNNFTTAAAAGNPGTDDLTQLWVGTASFAVGSYLWNGYMAEILIRSGADSAATRARIRSYFSGRYGV